MSDKISFNSENGKAAVLSYNINKLEPKTLYTVAVYQIEKKRPVIRQLSVNVTSTTPSKAKKVFGLGELKGDARGRRVYIDVYEQSREVPSSSFPSEKSREDFDLIAFTDANDMTLVDSKHILYTGAEYRVPLKRTRGRPLSEKEKDAYFVEWNNLTKKQKAYCRCVLHVAAENSATCNNEKKWGSGGCFNPYAVCAKSTKTSVRFCGMNYEWSKIPTGELQAFAELHKMKITPRTSRTQLLKMLKEKSVTETQKPGRA